MEDVKSTCLKEDCPLWKEYGEKCPNYIETVWINENNSQPKVLEDCAVKRTVTILMEIHNQIAGIKQYASQTRTVLDKLSESSNEFMIIQSREQESIDKRTRNIEVVTKKLVKNLIEAKDLVKKVEVK